MGASRSCIFCVYSIAKSCWVACFTFLSIRVYAAKGLMAALRRAADESDSDADHALELCDLLTFADENDVVVDTCRSYAAQCDGGTQRFTWRAPNVPLQFLGGTSTAQARWVECDVAGLAGDPEIARSPVCDSPVEEILDDAEDDDELVDSSGLVVEQSVEAVPTDPFACLDEPGWLPVFNCPWWRTEEQLHGENAAEVVVRLEAVEEVTVTHKRFVPTVRGGSIAQFDDDAVT